MRTSDRRGNSALQWKEDSRCELPGVLECVLMLEQLGIYRQLVVTAAHPSHGRQLKVATHYHLDGAHRLIVDHHTLDAGAACHYTLMQKILVSTHKI